MGKNVYAAPRKGPAGKWVEQSGDKPVMKDQQKAKQERLQALAAQYKKNKEKRYLRSLANTIDPVVQVGKASVNESVLFSLNEALEARELVKAKVLKNCLDEVKDVAQELADQSNAELVQVIGRNVVLYRRNPEKPMIELPKK